ncbi:hypothetical protein JFL43_19845 [Viridibacillus sp. YIM B01967]|uniref:Glycogen biosynthesis protein GlgD n=1 Tax=Viridibacillus soli TaxID=2798301 RepID=A0ABS1HC72_9BACL|nr:hypothetical protein [Viridibacillus soli]MBK3497047.1 hypothetical protein [Viridibacillus soli]
MAKNKDENNRAKMKRELGREEFGYGYDLSPDDFDVIGQNNEAHKQHNHEDKEKPNNKNNARRLNE